MPYCQNRGNSEFDVIVVDFGYFWPYYSNSYSFFIEAYSKNALLKVLFLNMKFDKPENPVECVIDFFTIHYSTPQTTSVNTPGYFILIWGTLGG